MAEQDEKSVSLYKNFLEIIHTTTDIFQKLYIAFDDFSLTVKKEISEISPLKFKLNIQQTF